MSPDAAYSALYAALASALPAGTPVLYDNRQTLDLSTEQRRHVRTEFIITSGAQKSLGAVKVKRFQGVLAMLVCEKEGGGVLSALDLADTLGAALEMRNFSGLQTQAYSMERSAVVKGWHLQPVSVPFWFDEVVALPD